jgi:hypothetical protein
LAARHATYAVSSSSSVNGDISVGTFDWRGTRTPVTGLATMKRSRAHQPKNADKLAR